jgi:hypothetical protein
MKNRFSIMVLASLIVLSLSLFAQSGSTFKVKPNSDSTPKKAAPINTPSGATPASQNAKALQNIEHENLKASNRQAAPKKAPPVTKVAEEKNPPINFGGQGNQKATALGGTDPYKGRLKTKGGDGHN